MSLVDNGNNMVMPVSPMTPYNDGTTPAPAIDIQNRRNLYNGK